MSTSSRHRTNFEVNVSKADFKFNAAHFVAYKGFRELLHGHNYLVSVRLLGSRQISHDGYVLDFGDVKKVTKAVCKNLNERFMCPVKSDVVDVTIVDAERENSSNGNALKSKSVVLNCEDGSKFVIPHEDCIMLPIVHATAEELAVYVWGEILNGLTSIVLRRRGIHTMEVTVAEAPGQEAVFRHEIPETTSRFDVASFIIRGDIQIEPEPCLNQHSEETQESQNTP
jgi:6-pyruvoyltetrahydropterin/6-carboxytetrahydropterin synthase